MKEKTFRYRKPNATSYLLYRDWCYAHNVPDETWPFHKKFTDEFGRVTGFCEVVDYKWLGRTVLGVCASVIVVRFEPAGELRTWVLPTDTKGNYTGGYIEQPVRDAKSWTLK